MTNGFEVDQVGTLRLLNLNQMALASALRVIEILQTVATNSDVGGLMADGENAMDDLQLLLKEINHE